MQIFIKTLTGNTITVDCDTVHDLKQKIFEREGIKIRSQRLNYRGRELDTESMRDGSTVNLTSRIVGGEEITDILNSAKNESISLVTLFIYILVVIITIICGSIYALRKQTQRLITVSSSQMRPGAHKIIEETTKVSIPWVIIVTAGLITFMYFGLKDLSLTDVNVLTPLLVILVIPYIFKYILKLDVPMEPGNVLAVLGLVIFALYGVYTSNTDDALRAISTDVSIVLVLSYAVLKYYYKLSPYESAKESALLAGSTAVFLLYVL